MKKARSLGIIVAAVICCVLLGCGIGVSEAYAYTAADSITTAVFKNTSSVNKQTVNAGESITLSASAEGGVSPYDYEYYYRCKGTDEWHLLDRYTGKPGLSRTASRSGFYELRSVITDAYTTNGHFEHNWSIVRTDEGSRKSIFKKQSISRRKLY